MTRRKEDDHYTDLAQMRSVVNKIEKLIASIPTVEANRFAAGGVFAPTLEPEGLAAWAAEVDALTATPLIQEA